MKIAVQGCAHGELEKIYDTITLLETQENIKIDLLLCCGDFQTSRNEGDLRCMAIPPKYYDICTFYKYYSGEKVAPVLTILIGGNHEASNYLQELPYGGWVAPNIYYLGYAGVVNVGDLRIAGISGIYKGADYTKGHFEIFPYDESTKRSVYHVRNLEVFRLKQLSQPIDIFLSHDWPTNVTDHGNRDQLIRFKPHFRDDIESKKLGSEPCEELLNELQPKYWFSAHLHCKFAALIPHDENNYTKFLALDKCLPKRRFLQVFDFPNQTNDLSLKYDVEWLTILMLTNHLLSVSRSANYMPGQFGNERYRFTPTNDEKTIVTRKLKDNLTIPQNFVKTANSYDPNSSQNNSHPLGPNENPQTVSICELLGLDDPVALLLKKQGNTFNESYTTSQNDSSTETYLNATLNSTTFFSDNFNTESSPSIQKSLSLPEPKNQSQELFFIDVNPSFDAKSTFKRRSNEDIIVKIDKNDDTNKESGVKKLKRRNFSIYNDEREESTS